MQHLVADRDQEPRYQHIHGESADNGDRERLLGPDHPATLTSCNNLAAAYARANRLRESIAYYKRALAGRKRVLGSDHPATRTTREALVRVRDRRHAAFLTRRPRP